MESWFGSRAYSGVFRVAVALKVVKGVKVEAASALLTCPFWARADAEHPETSSSGCGDADLRQSPELPFKGPHRRLHPGRRREPTPRREPGPDPLQDPTTFKV